MNRLRRRWWQLTDDEEGISLVEVLIAIFMLAVAIMALGSVGISSLIQLRMTRDREQATNAGSAAIEHVRAFDFGDIAHAPGLDLTDPDQLPLDLQDEVGVDGAECVNGEPLVVDGAASEPVPLHQLAGNQDAIDLYTIVTYADGACDPRATSNLKRVVSLARFVDGTRVEWVRQETLVASVGRGLPVPNFRVRPQEATLRFNPNQTEEGTRRCVDHQLRNLGAPDRYEWELMELAGEPSKTKVTGSGWRSANGNWELTAYLQVPESPSGDASPPDDEHRMKVDTGTGRFGSDQEVETGESATFTLCYEPKKALTDREIEVAVEVYSRFDDRRFAELRHNVIVEEAGEAYFLLDRIDDEAHPRPRDGDDIRPSLMDPNVTVGGSDNSLERIGNIDYTDATKSDWSTEVNDDVATVPGLRLPRDPAVGLDERTVDWRYQISPRMTLRATPTPRLVLWVAPTSVLLGEAVPVDGIRMRLEVQLDGLRTNENQAPFWSAPVHTYAYWHQTDGWERHEIELPLDADEVFQNNRRLRLRVTCHEESIEDCNLAYDNSAHLSRLHVDITP